MSFTKSPETKIIEKIRSLLLDKITPYRNFRSVFGHSPTRIR